MDTSLTEALDALLTGVPRTRKGPRCSVALAVNAMEESERNRLTHLIDETEVAATEIAKALRVNGYNVSGQVIARHRRRADGTGCQCP